MSRKGYFLIMKYLILILLFSPTSFAGNFDTFSKSKRMIASIYKRTSLEKKTFYCGCDFKGKKVDLNSCGYAGKKYKKRSTRIEQEHIVPASAFIHSFAECRKGKKTISRKKCAKRSPAFAKMEANPHNLVPAVGALNAVRSNYSFAEIGGEKREFGKCNFEVQKRKVEPPEYRKGDIARIYFYMDKKYPGSGVVSKKNKRLFEAWNKQDPVSVEECLRDKIIAKAYGEHNEFVKPFCGVKSGK